MGPPGVMLESLYSSPSLLGRDDEPFPRIGMMRMTREHQIHELLRFNGRSAQSRESIIIKPTWPHRKRKKTI